MQRAPVAVDRDTAPPGTFADSFRRASRGSRRDPRPAGSAGVGRGTMRRPWGALLLGALLFAHGKRRRRARANRPAGKVCPRVRLLQDSPPGSRTAQTGAWDPSPSLRAVALRLRAGEESTSSPSSSSLGGGSSGGRVPRAGSGPGWGEIRGARLPALLLEDLGLLPFQVKTGSLCPWCE